MKKTTGSLLLLLTALIWGAAFVAQRTGMDHVGPLTFQMARSVLALYSYDSNPDDISPENVLRQSIFLMATLPSMMAHNSKQIIFFIFSNIIFPPIKSIDLTAYRLNLFSIFSSLNFGT